MIKMMNKNFHEGPSYVQGTVVEWLAPLSFLVEVHEGIIWKHHKDHLKHLGDIATQANLPPQTFEQEAIREPYNFSPTEENNDPSLRPPTQVLRRYPLRDRYAPPRYDSHVTYLWCVVIINRFFYAVLIF